MNNPETSVMNDQKQHINVEYELNSIIIPNSNNPTELNMGNEIAGDKGSIVRETPTCLQDFDENLDNICKQNKTIDINTQCEIDLEGVVNGLNTSGEIKASIGDNLSNWQKIYEDFITGTKLNAVEYNNNYEEDMNINNYVEDMNINNSEVLIDSVEYFNKNNDLVTWNGIYESFLAVVNPVAAVNDEDSLILSKMDIQHENAMSDFSEHDKKGSSSREIKGEQFEMNTANKYTITCNNKNTIIKTNLNKKNTNMPELIMKIPDTISKNEFITISSDEEDAIEIVECNIPLNRQPTETNTFIKEECFRKNKNPTNTNEFEEQEVGTDCEGYNSSDFEFIDENEAWNASNFKWLADETSYGGATIKNKSNFEGDAAMTFTNYSLNFDEQNNESGELSLSKLKSLLGVHDHQNSMNYTEYDGGDNIIYDYFKTLQTVLNTNEFDTSYVDNHRIPNDEEYVDLFGGNHVPYAMNSFENKATGYRTGMTVNFDEGNFVMHASMRCDNTPEQRREAKETAEKILAMYSIENIGRNLRRRR